MMVGLLYQPELSQVEREIKGLVEATLRVSFLPFVAIRTPI